MSEKKLKILKRMIVAVQVLSIIMLLFLGYIIFDYIRNNEEANNDYYELTEPYEQ